MKYFGKGVVCCLLIFGAGSANALDFSFTGNLTGDDDVQLFDFSVDTGSSVTLRSWSYAGGTNSEGVLISDGGFDPILALFDGTGNLIDQNDDGIGVASDPTTGAAFDTLLTSVLGAGDYTVSVMQFSNFATGPMLSNGFDGSDTTNFVDVTGDTRTSAWAFDILNVNQVSPIPEPETYAMLLAGLGLLAFVARRRKEESL